CILLSKALEPLWAPVCSQCSPCAIPCKVSMRSGWRYCTTARPHVRSKVRSIGVSNFDIVRMRHLLRAARIKPAVNQVEVHPFLPQKDLLEFCRDEGVAIVAYAPLGAPAYPYDHDGPLPDVLNHPAIRALADRHGKTAAQIAIRWAIQRGTIVIPKSVHKRRIEENFDVFDFALSLDEMAFIDDIGRDPEDQIRAFTLPFAADGRSIFEQTMLTLLEEL
ncbi:hypothetical protein FOZ63_031768, partial [Perkinsus olseni]